MTKSLSHPSNYQKRASEKREAETSRKTSAVQVDDLLSFRQFSKKGADQELDVRI